jgi:nicotinamide riboside transporter PnuC
MDILNWLGLSAFLLTILAMYLAGRPDKRCWIIFIVSQVIQIYIFYKTTQWFLILQMLVLITFNCINYFKWKKRGINNDPKTGN